MDRILWLLKTNGWQRNRILELIVYSFMRGGLNVSRLYSVQVPKFGIQKRFIGFSVWMMQRLSWKLMCLTK